MASVILYSARACPFAHRSRLVLGHKGIDFELVEIDLQNKPAWFGAVSVYGKVPALEHEGVRVVESAIVNEYVNEVWPETPLLPETPQLRAAARIWIDYANTRFVPAWGGLLRGQSEQDRESSRAELAKAVEHLEAAVGAHRNSGPFWFGERPSLVDFAFYPWFERWPALHHFHRVDVPQTPHLRAWREAVAALPAARAIANSTSYYVERYSRYVAPAIAERARAAS